MTLRLAPPTGGAVREADAWGSGHFRAPRGERRHKGIDFLAAVGDPVTSPVDGHVRRIGWCYGDDPHYRLVEIETDGAHVRILYVEPSVEAGSAVNRGDLIGHAQDISARYDQGMQNHVHLEMRLTTALLGRGRAPTERVWIDPRLLMD
jgi:murein DD-endopeptidase MepM/ murein hydrolase activator NlpD